MNEPLTAELVDRADVVFHLAAAVGVKLIVEAPVRTIETNVHGTEIVLTHASKKSKLVVIFSTSEVYGKSTAVPFREDADLVLGPTPKQRWAYACSKAIDEFLALAYYRERKLPVIIVRLFNTVGPRQTGRYGMVIPNFVRQALAGEPITVYGDGQQTRSFTYVGDIVDGLIRLVNEPRAIGAGLQHRQHRRNLDPRPGAARADPDGQSIDVLLVPYEEAYDGRFRGHAAPGARPDEDSDARRVPADAELDEILQRVIDHAREASPRPIGDNEAVGVTSQDARAAPPSAFSRRTPNPSGASFWPQGAIARHDSPTSSRSKARTSATRSACSARATRCIGSRA